jgi:hypothetical protein
VAQLYPQAPGTHFSRLFRHAWATVGLFLFFGRYTEGKMCRPVEICLELVDVNSNFTCVRKPRKKVASTNETNISWYLRLFSSAV